MSDWPIGGAALELQPAADLHVLARAKDVPSFEGHATGEVVVVGLQMRAECRLPPHRLQHLVGGREIAGTVSDGDAQSAHLIACGSQAVLQGDLQTLATGGDALLQTALMPSDLGFDAPDFPLDEGLERLRPALFRE